MYITEYDVELALYTVPNTLLILHMYSTALVQCVEYFQVVSE